MADIFNKSKRSKIMSRVRATDTKPEIFVRKFLLSKGFRFRKNVKSLPGTPDIVLPKFKTVIFIHGCFWHGHKNCDAAKLPKTQKKYWTNKITANIKRDKTRIKELKKSGWHVITVWECKMSAKENRRKEMAMLMAKMPLRRHSRSARGKRAPAFVRYTEQARKYLTTPIFCCINIFERQSIGKFR